MSVFLTAVLLTCGLLLTGFVLRATLRPLQVLFIPASVVGGLVGFGLIQAGLRLGPASGTALVRGEPAAFDAASDLQRLTAAVADTLAGWPGWLIAVVFAGLLLEKSAGTFRQALRRAGRQGLVVWIIVLGQAMVGLLVAWLLILPFFDVPASFGQLIETGFAGGHGTAGAMGAIWAESLDFPAGRDLAFFFATFGLIYGVVSGIAWVNLGVRRGWTRAGRVDVPRVSGLEPRHDPPPAAFARVSGDVLDPLVFQALIVAAAFALGWAMQQAFIALASPLVPPPTDGEPAKALKAIQSIPLFLFTLLGGWVIRETMHRLGVGDLIDPQSVRRLVGAAMEFLIVAAIATLRVEALTTYWWPVGLLLLVGAAWTAFCLLVICPRLLPRDYWFELGLLNYGMSTATTAQGMMLLRIVDRDLDTRAAEDYAMAAPLSAPFIGGGVVTLSLPLLLPQVGVGPVVAVMAAVLVALYLLGRRLARDA